MSDTEWIGRVLSGKYRIDTLVGRGGFGTVYRGHHLTFDVPIAIKLLTVHGTFTGSARGEFEASFAEEGKLLFKLSRETTGIVGAIDQGVEVDGDTVTPFLVMDWLEGMTLEDELRGRAAPRSVVEAFELLEPAARALAVAHGLGVAHRDIKPANLFLARSATGEVSLKILDFGIAKVMRDVGSLTRALEQTQGVMSQFTPLYGAPEQFRKGKYGASGTWTDVFAFALVFVEVVTGQPALDGDDQLQLMAASTDAQLRPTLSARGVRASDAVEQVLSRALAVETRGRYMTIGEFWEALRAAVHQAPGERRHAPSAAEVAATAAFVSEAYRVLGGASAPQRASTTSAVAVTTPANAPFIPAAPPPSRAAARGGSTLPLLAALGGVAALALAGVVGVLALAGRAPPAPAASPATSASAEPARERPRPVNDITRCVEGARASSEQPKHPAMHAFDERVATAWNEDSPGDGTGEWVEARLPADTFVAFVDVGGGWSSRADNGATDLWTHNNSFRVMRVSWDGGASDVSFDRQTDRGVKKRVEIHAHTTSIRFTAVSVDHGRYNDLVLDDALIHGSTGSDCRGAVVPTEVAAPAQPCSPLPDRSCSAELFVQLATLPPTTPVDYDFPKVREILQSDRSYSGVRVVESLKNGHRILGAIVANKCQSERLTAAAERRMQTHPSASCQSIEVTRDVYRQP